MIYDVIVVVVDIGLQNVLIGWRAIEYGHVKESRGMYGQLLRQHLIIS